MTGTLRMMLAFAVLMAAGFGIYYLWSGEIVPYMVEIAATYGVLVLVILVITIITKPAGEKH